MTAHRKRSAVVGKQGRAARRLPCGLDTRHRRDRSQGCLAPAVALDWGIFWPQSSITALVASSGPQQRVRQRYIREAPLPRFLTAQAARNLPPPEHQATGELVERGLRQFFMACLRGNKQFVAMPSTGGRRAVA